MNSVSFRTVCTIYACILASVCPLPALAQSVTWIGSGTNNNWSTAANWTSTGTAGLWASGTGVNVTIGSITGSGTSFQNRTDYSGGVRIGSLTLASATPFNVTGSSIYLNGAITSTGSASRSVTAQLNLQRATTMIDVAAGSGRLTLGNVMNSSGSAATLRKTGAGEVLLSGFWNSGTATTFTLEQGTVSLAASPRQGFTPPSFVALGASGNGNFTAGVLRLDGGNLRAAVTGTTPFGPQYFIAPVSQDTILSGSTVSLGDPTGAMNARLGFYNGVRIDEASRVTVHNESILSRHISGTFALTVAGTGRLMLQGFGPAPASRLAQLTVDGGGVGVTSMSLVGLPANGLTLVNGGRLDSLSSFTIGGTSSQKITIGEGGGVLRSASPMSFADMLIQTGGLQGSGTLRVEATQPLLPPNMPAGYYVQPGRIVLMGSNANFTGNTVVNGGELQVRSLGGLGASLLAGGTQTIDVRAGTLNISGTTFGAVLAPDLSRVTVNKGGTLKLGNMSSGSFTVTAATVPAAPIAGMLGLEATTLSGSAAAIRVADGAIIQNSAVSGIATLRTNIAYASAASGTVMLAGSYVPNRRATWGGELTVNGQLTREAGAGEFDLTIKGMGVVMAVAQNTFAGQTTIDNGRLVLQHVNGLGGPGRVVTIKSGGQLDLTGTFTSAGSLPAIHAASAGMIGIGPSVSGSVVQSMSRGANSIGPSYYADYTYSLSSLPAVDGVYRFGTVTAISGTMPSTMPIPRSFTITQANVLTGSASVVVGATKGDAFGTAGSVLTLRANQNYSGGTLVRKDFFLAIDQALSSPFGTGPVTVQGVLLATGSGGSFVNVSAIDSQVTFAKGGELWLNNSSSANQNRWGDTTPITLNSGAIRMAGNASQAVSETVGTLNYAGGSRIYLDNITGSPTVQPSLTIESLAPQAGTRPTLEIFKTHDGQKVFVTQTPTTVGSANLIPGGFDRRNTTFLSWNSTTKELVAATPTISGTSFAGSTAAAYVNLTGPTSLSSNATALAVRTASSISQSNTTATLTIGDGTIGELLVPSGVVTIAPTITFAGDGLLFTGSGAKAMLTGVVTATNGLIKLGPGDLVLSNTTAVGGPVTQTLIVREGRLSGNGSQAWNVVIEGSGVFAPGNSPDISPVGGSLTMGADTGYEFELTKLDEISDKIVVAGDLTLDGFIDIIDWEVDGIGTMEVGTYDLITWGGNLIDNGVELRTLPDGFFGVLNLNLERQVLEFQVFSEVVAVPEPAAVALLAAGLPVAWLWAVRRRRGRAMTPAPA